MSGSGGGGWQAFADVPADVADLVCLLTFLVEQQLDLESSDAD